MQIADVDVHFAKEMAVCRATLQTLHAQQLYSYPLGHYPVDWLS